LALRIDDVDLQRDRMLVERFQEGDDTAFETLYRRYFARLQRFCLKRVGDPLEAEEIAQEAFTRAYRALPTLAGERRFYPWMTVIAGRLCVDHHRRRGRTEPSDVIELGAVEGGQEAIVEQADFALLTTALDRLAPRHREVLDMREHRGWSYQQIADHYEVSIGTVEALLFRARKALKREFLAVAGADRLGAWGAIPVLGAAIRQWGAFKAKVAAWASAAPAGVAPALGVVAVVGSVAAVGTAVLPERSAASDRPAAVVRTIGVAPAASTTSLGDAIDAAIASTTIPPASASRGERATSDGRGSRVVVAPTNTSMGSAAELRPEAEQQPVKQSATVNGKDVLVGLDPTGAVGDVLHFVSGGHK